MSRSPLDQPVNNEMPQDYAESFMALRHMLRQGSGWSGHEKNCMFLNTGGERFANISGISGFDFDDDARGVAMVDWDGDGDLDLWTSNRTGPRLRFFRNQNRSGGHWLALRLVGRTSNRDAIGSRVVVHRANGERLVRTLRAGEGFLSQSSRILHFGLGDDTAIAEVVVRWPDGQQQTFGPLDVDATWVIEEGGTPRRLPARQPLQLAAEALQADKVTGESRIVLASPVPAPPMLAQTMLRAPLDLQEFEGQPLLVNLWATWCAPCVKEMKAFTKHRKEIVRSGVEVVALSVDGVGEDAHGNQAAADSLVRALRFPFRVGFATSPILDMVGLVHGALIHTLRPFPIPTSLLIDPQGWVVAIYMGPIEVDQLVEDVATLCTDMPARRDAAVPFAGRWLEEPGFFDYLTDMGLEYVDAGYPQFGEHHYRKLLERQGDNPQWRNYLGQTMIAQHRYEDAVPELRRALAAAPGQPEVQGNLGVALAMTGNEDEARPLLEQSLAVVPHQPEAAGLLAWILATDPADGVPADQATEMAEFANHATGFQDPRMLDALAAAYARSGDFQRALTVVERAIQAARAQERMALLQEIQKHQAHYERQRPFLRATTATP